MSRSPISGQHLSEEQFSRMLAGESMDRITAVHLAGCPPCQAEVEAMLSSLSDFHAFSLAWAEREAPRRVRTPSRWALRLSAYPVWNAAAMAAATCVALALGFNYPHRAAAPVPSMQSTQAGGAAPSGAELAEDNRLLASIHQELSYTTEPTVPLADLQNPQDQTSLQDVQHPENAEHPSPAGSREAVVN